MLFSVFRFVFPQHEGEDQIPQKLKSKDKMIKMSARLFLWSQGLYNFVSPDSDFIFRNWEFISVNSLFEFLDINSKIMFSIFYYVASLECYCRTVFFCHKERSAHKTRHRCVQTPRCLCATRVRHWCKYGSLLTLSFTEEIYMFSYRINVNASVYYCKMY